MYKKKEIFRIVLLIAEIIMVFLLAAMLTNAVKATTLVDGNQIYTTNDSNNTNVTNNVYQPYVPEFPFFYPYPYYGYRYYGWSFFYWGYDEPRTYASSYTYTRTSSSLGGSGRYIVYPSTEDDGYGVLSPKSVKINNIEKNGEKITYEEEPVAGDINEARSHANAIGSTVEGEQNNIRSTTKTVEEETVGDSPKESLPVQGASNPREVQEVTSNQQNRESEEATSEGVTSERSGVQSGEDESIVNEAQSHASNGISEVPEDNYHPEENTYENTENTYENTESSSSSSSSEE